MGTTTTKLQAILDTKDALKTVLYNNDIVPPVKFSEYPNQFNTALSNLKSVLNIMDGITIAADTTVEQLNTLFNLLPDCNHLNKTELIGTCTGTTSLNIRSDAGSTNTQLGYLSGGDQVVIYGSKTPTDSTTVWYQIKEYRAYGDTELKERETYGYGSSAYITTEEITTYAKMIDISLASEEVQRTCSRSIIETKGWLLSAIYPADTPGEGGGEVIPPVEPTTNELTFEFDNSYTEEYSDSKYTNYLGIEDSSTDIRQGYYNCYYRGNIRFSDATLQEVKEILNTSTVNSMSLYLERTSTAHGPSVACKLFLYACDSTRTNCDLVENSGSLLRGASKWITLDSTIVDGFISGKYDHFEIYKASTAIDYYQRLANNAKLKINYTT